jgi:fucose 4-O-acetylase-like acetyltransferase
VFLTCPVVAHHAAQARGSTGGVWVVSDAAKAPSLGSFFFRNASYMMGPYFFISGYFLAFSVARKPLGQFSRDRFVRLGIPLAVLTLLVWRC